MSNKVIIAFEPQEIIRIEAILMDNDKDDALKFIREVIKPRVSKQTKSGHDRDKGFGTGIR